MRQLTKLALSCVLVIHCFAQSAGPAATVTRPTRRKMPGGERTMRGCVLKGNPDGYELQTTRGNRVRLSSSDDLSNDVGREVRVSGAFIDAPENPDTRNDPQAAAGSPSDVRHRHVRGREFQVVKVEVLANSCAAPSKRGR